MEANNKHVYSQRRTCLICKSSFEPDRRVKSQRVCGQYECQRRRQQLNNLDWRNRNPVDYQQWYQDYGKAYRTAHPDYQKQYRQNKQRNKRQRSAHSRLSADLLSILLSIYLAEKKEPITADKTETLFDKTVKKKAQIAANTMETVHEHDIEKKESLTPCYILIKGKQIKLPFEKKESIAYCFT